MISFLQHIIKCISRSKII